MVNWIWIFVAFFGGAYVMMTLLAIAMAGSTRDDFVGSYKTNLGDED